MFQQRIEHLRSICKEQQVDGFLISSASNIFYLSGFNRFLVDHDGYLLVTKSSVFLITSPLYTEAVRKFTPDLAILETSPDAWYSQMVKQIVDKEKLTVIGFEEKDLRVAEYFDLQEEKIATKSVSLRNLRVQKEQEEIKAVEKACLLTDKTFDYILPFVKEGVTELELSEKMSAFAKSQGAEIGFPSIVAFGRHSAVPHHMTSDEKLTKNSFVLFDFGLRADNYLSDMSRTVFFGTPSEHQVTLYETVKKSQEEAMKYISSSLLALSSEKETTNDEPQTTNQIDIFGKDVDDVARKVIENAGFPAYPHALGHGIGLEVHEAPTLSKYSPEKLIENMVFTIEPGIYLPELGGVRIEDMFVLQDNQLKQLTNSSKQLIILN
ncbi:MAG TPA: aminopeptidase P family protein [Candidatus Eisenbacteria bacterium]|nr:aminopeptidase P family protein [Candidatus Eisenbacteria bacterium]